ncbi:hypothetical protein EJ08DRAFT_683428 [Tothia fuscella]|uniref:Uncharacterized protein n=1 Tax=Tothia fuscella TaxID=1048955 RepID=A0A9P4NG01_9PEZI|nr:hypothetical protein EJ08DRAFT_683428 [Tothia fuscella]
MSNFSPTMQQLIAVILATFASLATCSVLCEGCRPLHLLNAPGVGIDLSMDYGTAAIRYPNSTTYDVAKIAGSVAYKRAMMVMAQDTASVKDGLPSMLPPIHYWTDLPPYDPDFQNKWDNQNIFFKIKTRYRLALEWIESWTQCPKCESSTTADPIVGALSDMISSLMRTVRADHLAATEFVSVSRPDFDWYPEMHHGRFTLATHNAGFRNFASYHDLLSSIAALWSFGLLDCEDELCEGEPRILVLHYSNSTLATTSMNSGNEHYPCRAWNHIDLGASGALRMNDPNKYWMKVKQAIRDALAPVCDGEGREPSNPAHVDQVVVIGERAPEPEFLRALQDIHGAMPRVHSTSKSDHVFAAARGAAAQARLGMVDGFNGCIPNGWCAEFPEEGSSGAETPLKIVESHVNHEMGEL